jgi:hypothetical protein
MEDMTSMNDCGRLVAIELLGRPHGREPERICCALRKRRRETIGAAIRLLASTGLPRMADGRAMAPS